MDLARNSLQKGIQLRFFLKQEWSGIPATQKQKSFQDTDIQLAWNFKQNEHEACVRFDLQESS